MRHDICFPLYLEVDEIYNLACPASPIHYQFDPVQTTKVNVSGSINMLGLAKRLKIKIFQASTSEVYGDPAEHPQRESYWGNVNPIGPRACYDEGKRCAETLFFDYFRQHGDRNKSPQDIQHVRPEDAPQRRQGREQLHNTGPQGGGYNRLRGRLSHEVLLLRGRYRGSHYTDDGEPGRVHGSRERREPGRGHHTQTSHRRL